jgi:HK97 family phage major capsid protein
MTSENPFAPETRENPSGFRTRDFTLQIEQRAADAPDDAPLRIAISSEAGVERYDWRTDEVYDEILDHSANGVDLSYARDGLPFLLDHNLGRQIGILENVSIDADRVIRGDFRPGNHPDAAWVTADMRAGVRKKVSVGYWPGSNYKQEKRADGTIARRYQGWSLYEASSVAVPADYSVGVGRSASGAVRTEQAVNPANSTETQMTVDTTSERGAAPAPDTRAAELAALASDFPAHARLAEWITGNVTVDAARTEIMRKLADAAATRAPINASQPAVVVGADREAQAPWAEDGADFFRAVVRAGRGGEFDKRLFATRAQDTVTGTDGGFALPNAVNNLLLEATRTGGEILSRVSTRPVTIGNSYNETLVKEEARTNGSRNGGVRGYWLAEDGSYIASQAETRQLDLKLQKLGAIVPVTEEQMEDGPALVSFINEQVPEELRFNAEQAVWEGTGVGQPLGALVSGALITVPIQPSQTIANTAGNLWTNAADMYRRMPARMVNGAAWFINQELWSKILTATSGTGGGSHPMFTPAGRLESAPNGSIHGRPIVPVEYASAEGTVGDFVFANFADYLLISKGGIRQQTSMHVEFLRDRQVLKFTWRVNGAPRTRVPLTPLKGTNTTSPYIALAARS